MQSSQYRLLLRLPRRPSHPQTGLQHSCPLLDSRSMHTWLGSKSGVAPQTVTHMASSVQHLQIPIPTCTCKTEPTSLFLSFLRLSHRYRQGGACTVASKLLPKSYGCLLTETAIAELISSHWLHIERQCSRITENDADPHHHAHRSEGGLALQHFAPSPSGLQ